MRKRSEPYLERDLERIAVASGLVGDLKLVEVRGPMLFPRIAALMSYRRLDHPFRRRAEAGDGAVDGLLQHGSAPGRPGRLCQQRRVPEPALRAVEFEADPRGTTGRRHGWLDGELGDEWSPTWRRRERAAPRDQDGRDQDEDPLPR